MKQNKIQQNATELYAAFVKSGLIPSDSDQRSCSLNSGSSEGTSSTKAFVAGFGSLPSEITVPSKGGSTMRQVSDLACLNPENATAQTSPE